MLPRIQAEEKLSAFDVALIGSGAYEAADVRRMVDNLEQTKRGGEDAPKVKASPAQLGLLGIGVTIVPPPSAENADG